MDEVAVEGEAEVEEEVAKLRQPQQAPSTRVLNTQISQLETGQGAVCIINGGGVPSSAQNLLHALGRMSTLQNLQNEPGTSLVTISSILI